MKRTGVRVAGILAAATTIVVTGLGAAPTATAATATEVAFGGPFPAVSYAPGGLLLQTGYYRAIFQTDGNLVVYFQNRALWSTRTAGQGARTLALQTDCNMVIYGAANRVLWTSRSAGGCNPYWADLVMQGDGNLVEYTPIDGAHSRVLWNSGSVFH